jgi:methylglutaconyl-CoA hydratase
MITSVVDDDALEAEVHALASRLVKNSMSAMGLTKHMLNAVHGMSLDAGLQYATAMNALARQTDDCKRGIASFLNSSKG